MRKHDDSLLLDALDDLDDEPADLFSLPEIRQELAHEHHDDELGLSKLWDRPEARLPSRLARVSAAELRRMYAASSESRETFFQPRT